MSDPKLGRVASLLGVVQSADPDELIAFAATSSALVTIVNTTFSSRHHARR